MVELLPATEAPVAEVAAGPPEVPEPEALTSRAPPAEPNPPLVVPAPTLEPEVELGLVAVAAAAAKFPS